MLVDRDSSEILDRATKVAFDLGQRRGPPRTNALETWTAIKEFRESAKEWRSLGADRLADLVDSEREAFERHLTTLLEAQGSGS
jgi:hypothetical protein